MLLSVIIPTCNRNNLLKDCLQKLEPSVQIIDNTLYEIIISDDGSDPNAALLIKEKFQWAKWVEGPKKGPAANRNNGARYAKGDWLIFIDDDCIPDFNLLNAYKEAINNHENISVFEGFTTVEREQKNFMEESPINTTGGFLWSCNFMINNHLFNNILKGFDEGYPYASMEDVDLQHRLKLLEEPIQFVENAIVIHPWRLQIKPIEIGRKRFLSMLYFVNKFPEKKNEYNSKYYIQAFFSTAKGVVKNSLRYKFRGFTKRILVIFMQLYFALRMQINNSK